MPVNLLYCEGVSKGSDTRVLSALFSGIPVIIKPIGSKHGAGRRVIGARDIKSGSNVFGLKDRDFDDDDSAPVNEPREWKLANEKIGWSWERKEIENYLIDPKVVKYFTIFFAGKDLLYGMRKKLKEFGFKTPLEFRERVLKGIENSTEDAWTWLSEWQKLREYISN